MTRSNLDGPTLAEKRYGKEYRPDIARSVTVQSNICLMADCSALATCTIQVNVDDAPPPLDRVTRLLGFLHEKCGRAWVTVPLCMGHGKEVLNYGLEYIDNPDTWAPKRENPPMFPHPLKVKDV